jgi:hypothetical protein
VTGGGRSGPAAGAGGRRRVGDDTGANGAAPPPTGRRVEQVIHRGIRWQRAASGRLRWWNEDDGAWVRYHPGDDAPPRPPGWQPTEGERPGRVARARWRSPFRIIPILLALLVIGIGLQQALTTHQSSTSEARQAQTLDGKCLRQTGTSEHGPVYSTRPVACSSPSAAVRVVAVLPPVSGGGPAPACPPGSAGVVLLTGAAHPHVECVAPLHHKPPG